MNKRELIKATAKITGCTAIEVDDILSTAIEVAAQTLIRGGKITITNYGTFDTRTTARKAYNFTTGTTQQLEARRRVIFRTGQGLNQRLNDPIKQELQNNTDTHSLKD